MVKFLCSKEIDELHRRNLLRSFLEDRAVRTRGLTFYCKSPLSCEGITVLTDDALTGMVSCGVCGFEFCSSCDMLPHLPATCEMVKVWEERGGFLETGISDEDESRKLKMKTTKPCPKCGIRIEKNLGCPHMSCKREFGGCGYEVIKSLLIYFILFYFLSSFIYLFYCYSKFCWECGGANHTSSQCTKPKEVGAEGTPLAFELLEKRAANYFLGKKSATEGLAAVTKQIASCAPSEIPKLKVKADAWQVLRQAQSALAHCCMVIFKQNTAKIEFLDTSFNQLVQLLQSMCEERWSTTAKAEAESLIRVVRQKLKHFILAVQGKDQYIYYIYYYKYIFFFFKLFINFIY